MPSRLHTRLAEALARIRRACRAEAFARRRVPLGFIGGALTLWLAQPTPRSLAAGSLLACAGEALRIWAAGHLNKSREVTTSGPYRFLSHPLYAGSSIMGAGVALASNSMLVALLVAMYLGVTIGAAISTEEASLRAAFGDRYDRYKRGTSDTARKFSVRQALANREHRSIAGLALAVLLLLLKATYNGAFGAAAGR